MDGENTVYFLGAGASADARVPLTNKLLERVAERIKSKPSALKRFIESFGFLEDSSTGRPPIVDAISLLDSCLRESRPLDRFFSVDRLRKTRNQLTVELSEVIRGRQQFGDKVQMPEGTREQPGTKGLRIAPYFKVFARFLRARDRRLLARLGPGDAVITTNYDMNIEVALYELAYWEETGGKPSYSNVSDVFLGSDFRDPYEDVHALSEPEKVVDVLKLHGSLNWLYCPRCSRIYISAFGFSVRFLTQKNKEELTCHCGYYSLEPVIVAPSAFQEIANPHLQAIWMNAYQVLENADTWVFVGYSLPAEDLAVRSLLYRAMSGRKYKKGARPSILVICLKGDLDELTRRYVGLLGKPIKFDTRRFRDYVLSRDRETRKGKRQKITQRK